MTRSSSIFLDKLQIALLYLISFNAERKLTTFFYEKHAKAKISNSCGIELFCYVSNIGCFPVKLLHIFRAPFSKNTSGQLLLECSISGLLIQFLGGVLVFIPILPRGDKSKWLIAAALAQISEFSFVLGSRARRFGLIGREVT